MKKRWSAYVLFLLPLLVLFVVLGFLAVGLTLDKTKVPSPLIGKLAPEFTLPTLSNSRKTITFSKLRGEPVVFNVWASWCFSCRQEHRFLGKLARLSIAKACGKPTVTRNKRRLVAVYGLNYKDKRDAAQGFLKQFGNPYVASAYDLAGRVGIDWGVYAVPETFVVDKKGFVRYKYIGPINDVVIERELIPLLCKLDQEP